ncbi:MAG: DUF309 domain-containing protein [Rhizobiales bacterium]|nr:DUF309 domain-containing protein [Hyphomicrobiales bacterium]
MSDRGAFPPYAYVPGQTERHPEGWFDDIRNTVPVEGAPEVDLMQCKAFVTGLAYIESGYFWEAHEVLEPVWMASPQRSECQAALLGLIQLANAQLKETMEQPKAALRLYIIAKGHFNSIKSKTVLGIDVQKITSDIEALHQTIIMQNNA